MHVVERFLNRTEEIVFKELSSIASDNSLRVFSKARLSDVIVKGDTFLGNRTFEFYTQAHFDFVITSNDNVPFLVVEYDGPSHREPKQFERDSIKNDLCKQSGLPLLRINARYVMQRYRGMTLLRWIVEVMQLQKCFDEAQAKGQVPYDEAFDPAMIISDGSGRNWPYWLALDANLKISRYFETQPGAKRLSSSFGLDANGNTHYLSYLRVGDNFLWAKPAARDQDTAIPVFDMLDQIGHYELGMELENFLKGKKPMLSRAEFEPIHQRMCAEYNITRSDLQF
jgi:very-short-patch-repair endonuclease